MQVIYLNNIEELRKVVSGGVFAIGNFDGVHNGHKELFFHTKALASELKVESNWGVICFTPNTKLWLSAQHKNYEILTSDAQKLNRFKELQIPVVVVINFAEICKLSAVEFISQYLINKLGLKGLVTGASAKLGNDLVLIKDVINSNFVANGISYKEVDLVGSTAELYSSSLVKKLLKNGDIKSANNILGYNFTIQGTVIHGNKLGRKLGFPTANVIIAPYVSLKYGIYITKVLCLNNNTWYNSVSNFGVRPTVNNDNKQEILEVNIFDFNEDLYGQEIAIKFIDYIRPEEKFNSLDEMVEQIKLDVQEAKAVLNNQPN